MFNYHCRTRCSQLDSVRTSGCLVNITCVSLNCPGWLDGAPPIPLTSFLIQDELLLCCWTSTNILVVAWVRQRHAKSRLQLLFLHLSTHACSSAYVSILRVGMLWRYYGNKQVPQISRNEAQQNFFQRASQHNSKDEIEITKVARVK
jgi:hypothetical protein